MDVETKKLLTDARIALTFYREWMYERSVIAKTTYPFGIEVEEKIAALLAEPEPDPDACPYCEGEGKEPVAMGNFHTKVRCRFCGGTGKKS